jgi:hypothetical protein
MTRSHPTFDADWRTARAATAYQPFFCEENVWRLLRDGAVPDPCAALFVSNRTRTVAMWGQRAAQVDPIVWDYHAVAVWLDGDGVVIDLDDRERVAWPLAAWLAHAFAEEVTDEFAPRFRLVPKAELLERFSSDRSHMRDRRGRPTQPFPAWPAPYDPQLGMTLPRFFDLDDPIAGVVTDRAGLAAAVRAARG